MRFKSLKPALIALLAGFSVLAGAQDANSIKAVPYVTANPKPIPKTKDFVPFTGAKRRPSGPVTSTGPSLPVTGHAEEEEDRDRLIERWNRVLPPDQVAQAYETAAKSKSEDSNAALRFAGQWNQIGLGITDNNPTYNKAGRITEAQYNFDHAQGSNVLYVSSSSGGLWKVVVVVFFAVFTPISDTMPGSPSIGAFAVSPTNSNKIIVGTGDYYRYGGSGIYRTTNGGTTWTKCTLPTSAPAACFKAIVDKDNPERVLMATSNGIFRTNDFGQSWSRIYSGFTTDIIQDPTYHYIVYAGVFGSGVMRSLNGGEDYDFYTAGMTGPLRRINLAICAGAVNYVYASAEGTFGNLAGVYRSTYYGESWTNIRTTDAVAWGQAFHTGMIYVSPFNANVVIHGWGGSERTNNALAATPTWFGVDLGHADFTGMIHQPGSPSNAAVTNDGGVYMYDVDTNTLATTSVNTLGLNCMQTMGMGCLDVSRTAPNIMQSGLQDNGMVRIDSTASPAIKFLGGGDGGPGTISPDNSANWAFSSGAAYYRFTSNNSGSSWVNVLGALPTDWTPSVVIDPTPGFGTTMYTNSGTQLYYRGFTTGSWLPLSTVSLPTGFNTKQLDAVNSQSFYAFYTTAWGDHRAFRKDGGLGTGVYTEITPPLPIGSTQNDSFIYTNHGGLQNDVYYVTAGARPSRAFLSTNKGASWINVTGNANAIFPDANFLALTANPVRPSELYLGTNMGILRSDDLGTTWYRFMKNLPTVADVVTMKLNWENLATPKLRIGTYGRGYWERDLEPVTYRTLTINPVLQESVRTNVPLQLIFRTSEEAPEFVRDISLPTTNSTVTITNIPANAYQVRIKAETWLSRLYTLDFSGSSLNLGSFQMLNGDVDGNNVVDLSDYLTMVTVFDTSPVPSSFYKRADLNWDNIVDLSDYLIMTANFDEVGQDF